MKYWGLTDKGAVRSMNQDAFFADSVGTLEGKEVILCLVCDGMGGAAAGEDGHQEQNQHAYGQHQQRLVWQLQLLTQLLMVESTNADTSQAYLHSLQEHRLRHDAEIHIYIFRLLDR